MDDKLANAAASHLTQWYARSHRIIVHLFFRQKQTPFVDHFTAHTRTIQLRSRMEKIKKDFGHPYEPYQIQNEMMDAIYDCIEKGQVGLFESPTGIVIGVLKM